MQRYILSIITVLLLSTTFMGCGPQIAKDAVKMDVQYSWAGTVCKPRGTSPEIILKNVPKGTTKIRVEVSDLDYLQTNHGAGEINGSFEGTVNIPKKQFEDIAGPCPPPRDGWHRYSLLVRAFNSAGVVVGEGEKIIASNNKEPVEMEKK